MIGGLPEALAHLFTWDVIILLVVATSAGMITAILPGIAPITIMALMLPFTLEVGPENGLVAMVAVMASAGFAGSVTSILINVPGDGINAATCLDGFPMARQGRAGIAIGASAAASALGALFGLAVLVALLPIMRGLILLFGPPEFFALSIIGLAMIATVSSRAPVKGLIAGALGMAAGFVGASISFGGSRFTFGVLELQDGIRLVPAIIGLFSIPVMFDLLTKKEAISTGEVKIDGQVWLGVREVLRRPGLVIRSSLIGTVVGAIPGVGGSVATWLAYFGARASSRHPENFGRGDIEGVIAPEAAVEAKEGASMIPVLALGLPGSVSTAILLAALTLQGIYPGQRLFDEHASLIWLLIFGMVFANLFTSGLGLLFASTLVRLTRVPSTVLAPIVLVFGALGAYADRGAMFGLALMLGIGSVGVLLQRFKYPAAPFIVGIILIPLVEKYFHQSRQLYVGSMEFLVRPLTLTIIVLGIVALFLPTVLRRLRGGSPLELPVGVEPSDDAPIAPIGDAAFSVAILATACILFIQTLALNSDQRIFPQAVLAVLAILALIQIALAVRSPRTPPSGSGQRTADVSAIRITLWIVLLPCLIVLLGMSVGTGAYIPLFVLAFERRRLTLVRASVWVLVGVGFAVFTHLVFTMVLGIRFEDPQLFELFR